MVNLRNVFCVLLMMLASCSGTKYSAVPKIENGVSKTLAQYRKSVINNVQYNLQFDIPGDRRHSITATEVLSFDLIVNKEALQIDFREESRKIRAIKANGKSVPVIHDSEHLIIDPHYLGTGKNEISIDFEAGEGALNRNADYLYTLFVPDRARTVFPCFDQPDLKATYLLTLKVPVNWKAIANASLKDSVVKGDRKTYHYATSDTLSTYLFAFAAGKFDKAVWPVGKGEAEFLYRETDTAKIKHSVNEIFLQHTASLKFMEDWTQIPYPFQKFGFVAIPDFQFGGMEHPGNIQYKASALFLDAGATRDQLNARTNVIAHETAHMWFGDLVTMNWFNDVWMKEVFANFMADKSTENLTGKEVFDLKFLVDHFPAAYGIDRTQGSNPIRQDLDNLKDAGTMYGNIIYHKAPIMMQQLERLMGREKFQAGIREYLKKFAHKNASWPDLIAILSKHTSSDLQKWNKVWVNDTGRPVIDYVLEQSANKVSKFSMSQKPEYGAARVWPQLVEVKFYYPDRTKEFTVNFNRAEVDISEAIGAEMPLFVQFNSSGQGYGLWPADLKMLPELYIMNSPLNRSTAYVTLYENMLNGRYVKPGQLLTLFMDGLQKEKEELNVKLITGYLANIYWEFIAAKDRVALAPALEHALWNAMQHQVLPNNKKLLFKAYQDIFLSASAKEQLYKIWNDQQAPAGLKLTEDDYTALAFSLALREVKDTGLLSKQLSRITNTDRRIRFEFIMPAVSPKVTDRDAFFKSLALKSNRTKESNVGSALYYLHHPLRQASSIKYLPESLEMLSEIQTTGDIFFPQNWLQATFSYYQSAEAAKVIRDFLQRNPGYSPKLKAKILQAADHVFRAEQLLKN